MGKLEEELDKYDDCHRFYLTYTASALSGELSKVWETSE
jgi:hypothetical protein